VLHADGKNVYAAIGNPTQLWRIAPDGSAATKLADDAGGFVLVGDSVYFARANATGGTDLVRVCK
jgi:hypothetical protein